MDKNNEIKELNSPNMVDEINHINENLKAILELGGKGLEYLEVKDKESNAMNIEMHAKEVEASNSKHKRVVLLIVYAASLIMALCVAAFVTDNAEYIKDILFAVALLLGGASIPKHLKSD